MTEETIVGFDQKNKIKKISKKNLASETLEKAPRLAQIELSKIYDTHKAVQCIKSELNIRPMRLPALAMDLDQNFKKIFDFYPVIVIKVGAKIQCIGCYRLLLAAKATLNPSVKIWCVELFDISDNEIQERFVWEYIYFPLVYGVHFGERTTVNTVAQKAFDLKKWTPPKKYLDLKFPISSYISKIYGIDDRSLHVQTDEDIQINDETSTDSSYDNMKSEKLA